MGVQEDLNALAGKQPGDLIQAAHWNALVAAVKLVEQSLRQDLTALADSTDERFAAVSATLDALGGRIDGVEGRVDALETGLQGVNNSLAALRARFRRVTMRTGRATYALGELAEITAKVSDVDGADLDLSVAANRPWVDFVTVWGQLRPAPGFLAVGGGGDRTLCVRVNAQGEAKVLLRADHAADLSEEVELQMATFMTTKMGAQEKEVSAVFLDSNTPSDDGVKDAFRRMSAEYDRAGGRAMREYVDGYYLHGAVAAADPPVAAQTWRDYRTTVVALVKGDNDPVTADPSLGSCSLQITFRDWIGPWIVGTYFPSFEAQVPSYQDKFHARVGADFRESVEGLKIEVSEIVKDKGVLGRQRDYLAMDEALDRLNRPDPPPFFSILTHQVQGAIRVQQAVDQGRVAAAGKSEAAFFALTDAQARADSAASATKEELGGFVEQRMGELETQMKSHVQQAQQTFRDDLLAESGPIKAVERQVGAMTGTVAALKALNVADVASGITVIRGMDNRLKNLELGR
ncbi:MAG: hypothetical protein HZB55_07340 [Deltaproteobacteria bacterium]|nr:hypothetical protein [Deltaproteobacteria bacterium]